MKLPSWISSLCVSAGLLSAHAYAQDGDALFKTYCAACHEAGGDSQVPNREMLSRMSPEQILQSNPPCGNRKSCKPSHAAAVTAIPGAVFSGTMDGQLYAYSAETGKILWQFDSVQDYSTVNGVKANGGSMSNAGATVVGGMLFLHSGYSHHGAIIPGNVLLAFALE